jgi:hypothetical protein
MSEVKQPIFDVISLVLALALLDDAFESDHIRSVEDIFRTRVALPRRSVEYKVQTKASQRAHLPTASFNLLWDDYR